MLRMYCQRFGMTARLAGLTLLLIFAGACPVQAGPSLADTVRFLQQSGFGPTSPLISRVQQIGFEAFLNEQFSAPMMDYPNLEFWPQTRPTSCTGPCQRDNYTLYPLQRHFFSNASSLCRISPEPSCRMGPWAATTRGARTTLSWAIRSAAVTFTGCRVLTARYFQL